MSLAGKAPVFRVALSLLAMGVGCLVLVGWWLELDALRRVVPGGLTMNPTSALLFVLLGGALGLVSRADRTLRRMALGVTGAVLAVSAIVFVERMTGLGWGLDQLLLADRLRALTDSMPSLMRLNTALCFMLLSAALILAQSRGTGRVVLSQALSLGTAVIALVAVVSYAYRVPSRSPFATYLPMALHTGVTLLALAVGVLLLHPDRGLMSVLFRRDPGGQVARRLLPPFILLPIGLGYVQLRGVQLGWYDPSVGVALLVAGLIACSMALLWGLAFSLSRTARARAQAEEALRLSEALLAEAQTIARMGSWEHCPATGMMAWSDEMFRLLGFEPRAVVPSPELLLERLHPDDRELLREPLGRGEPLALTLRWVRPDGTVRSLAVRGAIVADALAGISRYVGVAQDVTEAREVERLKDEFISVVSHELRTPLTAIRGSLGLLETGRLGELAPQGKAMLELAARNSDRLVRLINDILDVERMAAGNAVMQRRDVTAQDLIRQAEEAMGPLAQKSGVTIVVEPCPVTVHADADRLVQVLTNLIDNAIKFSVAGSTVRLGAVAGEHEVRFHVADRGRGIPPEFLERIFQRFGQVDASDSRKKGGTGLGLTICRRILELHGGQIWATSELGQGSTFYFTLPRE